MLVSSSGKGFSILKVIRSKIHKYSYSNEDENHHHKNRWYKLIED